MLADQVSVQMSVITIISVRQNHPELQQNVHTPISAQMEDFATTFIYVMECCNPETLEF